MLEAYLIYYRDKKIGRKCFWPDTIEINHTKINIYGRSYRVIKKGKDTLKRKKLWVAKWNEKLPISDNVTIPPDQTNGDH